MSIGARSLSSGCSSSGVCCGRAQSREGRPAPAGGTFGPGKYRAPTGRIERSPRRVRGGTVKLRRNDREVFGLGAWLFALLAVLLAFGALGVAASANSKSNDAKKVAAVGGSGGAKVTLTEFKIDPSMISAAVGGTISVTNGGTVAHDFAVQNTNLRTKMLNPGESATLTLTGLKKGNYTAICEVPGHADSGMKAMLM